MPLNIAGFSSAFLAAALLTSHADAQFSKGTSPPALPQDVPAGAVQQLPEKLTPKQIKDILLLRALQSRGKGGRGVRTGVPQFVPFGNPGFFGFPVFPLQNAQPQAPNTGSAQKKDQARAARAERHRVAREQAKAKRKQAAEARAKARDEAKAKDEEKDAARP